VEQSCSSVAVQAVAQLDEVLPNLLAAPQHTSAGAQLSLPVHLISSPPAGQVLAHVRAPVRALTQQDCPTAHTVTVLPPHATPTWPSLAAPASVGLPLLLLEPLLLPEPPLLLEPSDSAPASSVPDEAPLVSIDPLVPELPVPAALPVVPVAPALPPPLPLVAAPLLSEPVASEPELAPLWPAMLPLVVPDCVAVPALHAAITNARNGAIGLL
jgi:hypothetical protein